MSPPPWLCSLSVRMAVKCGILDAEVSFDSFIVTTSGCVHEMLEFFYGALYSVCIELKNFYLCVLFWMSFVFRVWEWGCEELGWVLLGEVCGRVGCIQSRM